MVQILMIVHFCLFGSLYVVHQIDTLIVFIAVAYKFLFANINGLIIIFLQTRKNKSFSELFEEKKIEGKPIAIVLFLRIIN